MRSPASRSMFLSTSQSENDFDRGDLNESAKVGFAIPAAADKADAAFFLVLAVDEVAAEQGGGEAGGGGGEEGATLHKKDEG